MLCKIVSTNVIPFFISRKAYRDALQESARLKQTLSETHAKETLLAKKHAAELATAQDKITQLTGQTAAQEQQIRQLKDNIVQNNHRQAESSAHYKKDLLDAKAQLNIFEAAMQDVQAQLEEINIAIGSFKKNTADMQTKSELAKASLQKSSQIILQAKKSLEAVIANMPELQGIISVMEDISGDLHNINMNLAIQAATSGKAGAGFQVISKNSRDLNEKINGQIKIEQGIIQDKIISPINVTNVQLTSGATETEHGVILTGEANLSAREQLETTQVFVDALQVIATTVKTHSQQISAFHTILDQLISAFEVYAVEDISDFNEQGPVLPETAKPTVQKKTEPLPSRTVSPIAATAQPKAAAVAETNPSFKDIRGRRLLVVDLRGKQEAEGLSILNKTLAVIKQQSQNSIFVLYYLDSKFQVTKTINKKLEEIKEAAQGISRGAITVGLTLIRQFIASKIKSDVEFFKTITEAEAWVSRQ